MKGRTTNPVNKQNTYNIPGKEGEKYLEIPLRDETIFVPLFQFNETNFLVKSKDAYCLLLEVCEDW